jgi:S1-C subfamily serine protease
MKSVPFLILMLCSIAPPRVLSFVTRKPSTSLFEKSKTKTSPTTRAVSDSVARKAISGSNAFSVPAAELEKDLSPDERTVVQVVRKNGPSVAFVTSIWPGSGRGSGSGPKRQRRGSPRQGKEKSSTTRTRQQDFRLPQGQSLGSGSGFVVDSAGYLVTNYHVIERAYQIQQAAAGCERFLDQLAQNITTWTGILSTGDAVHATLQRCMGLSARGDQPLPAVYVRVNSATNYQLCDIVDVKPELDVAVLKIVKRQDAAAASNKEGKEFNPLSAPFEFGSSSNLLVGQSLIAIGNPFGLDNTVTTGVVSALNRELRTGNSRTGRVASLPIRNCIQTDCAINPGNSGGPLLNLRGQVVGINTAIVTTSGSNAGIGFAVPSDQIRPVVEKMIRHDRLKRKEQKRGWMGVSIISMQQQQQQQATGGNRSLLYDKNWIMAVRRDSPADKAGMRPLRVFEQDASVAYGDAIVAVAGNEVKTYAQLQAEMDRCMPSEKIAVTLEDAAGDRRVVYLDLVEAPTE